MYRVLHQLSDLGRVDIYLRCLTSCPAAQPFLPKSHLPKQNWADSGIFTIRVNPTKVRKLMEHPVAALWMVSVIWIHIRVENMPAIPWWKRWTASAGLTRWSRNSWRWSCWGGRSARPRRLASAWTQWRGRRPSGWSNGSASYGCVRLETRTIWFFLLPGVQWQTLSNATCEDSRMNRVRGLWKSAERLTTG